MHWLTRVSGLVLLGVAGFALTAGGYVWAALVVVGGVLAALLSAQWRQLDRLAHWLELPQQRDIPDAEGPWGEVFATLYKLRREERAGREHLSSALGRLRQAAGAMPDGVVLLDGRNAIEWLNAAAARHLGLDAQRDRGTPIAHLVRDPAFQDYVQRGDTREPIVLRGPGDAGMLLSLVLIPYAEGGRLLLSRDVSREERADATRRDFIANVSHELRTPLTVILGFLEPMIDEEADTPTPRGRALALMNEQAQRMRRLVEDLLQLSRLENSPLPASEQTVNVPALVAALAEEARALSGGQHTVVIECAKAALRGDPDELRSAFGNLVSNAIRYTPTGGVVTLRWKTQGELGIFEVEDSGIGIAAAHLPRLTERFYRVDRGRSSATGGTGLGLAITRHVALRHEAKLEVESEPGRGSHFRIVFPASRLIAEEETRAA
jgi:two-component system phosphate regulon sensor histidine kinase PhoR